MRKRVLVVDDSRAMRMIVVKCLKLGVDGLDDVLEAGDGLEALKILRHEDVSGVFLDLNMPRMNGVELLRLLRQNEEFAELPVVIFSSESREEKLAPLRALGVERIIRKPTPPEELVSIFHEAMEPAGA